MSGSGKLNRKKWLLIVAIIGIVGLLVFVVVTALSSAGKGTAIKSENIISVERGGITAVFSSPATVESGNQGAFDILEGAKVTEVNVRVGDLVKKGDLLASFDATSLDSMLDRKRKDFESAEKSYGDYLKAMADAPKQAEALKKRIAELEKNISEMTADSKEKAESAAGNPQLEGLKKGMALLLGNGRLANIIVDSIFRDTGSVAQTMGLFQNLLSGSFLTGASSNSIAAMMNSINSLTNPELMGSSLELVQLKVQESMLGFQSGTSLESMYKALSDSAETAYLQTEETVRLLKTGWIAEYDGIIREVNVAEGEVYRAEKSGSPAASTINVTSLLASLSAGQADIATLLGGLFSSTVNGMVVEYYPFTASFMLGKYDIAKVSLDQKVLVTSVTGKEFDASVTYISPVAKEGGELNISSLMGAGSGSRGVEARITIPKPDESITIGLDVDVTIDLEERPDVLYVPAESILYDEELEESYVFLYNSSNKTIVKQIISVGLFDGANYEITEGLEEGQKLVRTPVRTWESGQKVRVG